MAILRAGDCDTGRRRDLRCARERPTHRFSQRSMLRFRRSDVAFVTDAWAYLRRVSEEAPHNAAIKAVLSAASRALRSEHGRRPNRTVATWERKKENVVSRPRFLRVCRNGRSISH